MSIEERDFATIDAAARALADDLANALRKAISARGRALLAVSGGRTPRHVFDYLNKLDVDWPRVTVTLTDERWVPADHPDSNEGLARSSLLRGPAAAATFIPLYGGEASPEDGQAVCEARLSALAMPFDAIYLGLGGDGHFASLFPGDAALDAHGRICIAVPGTETRQPRMTLTASAIMDAREVFLMFSGTDKHAVYAEARTAGPYEDIPVRLVLDQERTPVSVLMAP
ncbi:MAG: 6-phosphogluconolactonase [Alphaproteobacteria bacterium]